MGIIIALFGIAAVVALSVIGISALNGWVLTYLWAWFIVPLGAHPITLPWAIGIIVTVSYFLPSPPVASKDKDEAAKALTNALVRPLAALATGWFIHWLTTP
jgi:hypothetical protein